MCCDAHTQGSRVKVVPLILHCASSGGHRVYSCVFYAASIQHWEGGLHLFSHSGVFLVLISQSVLQRNMSPISPASQVWTQGTGEMAGPLVPEINGMCSTKEPSSLLPASLCSMCSHCPLLVPYCREAASLRFWRQVWIVPL